MQDFRGALQSSTNQTKRFRIALQMQAQQHLRTRSRCVPRCLANPLALHPSAAQRGTKPHFLPEETRSPGGETMPFSGSPYNLKITGFLLRQKRLCMGTHLLDAGHSALESGEQLPRAASND